jgi:hypothetical protein
MFTSVFGQWLFSSSERPDLKSSFLFLLIHIWFLFLRYLINGCRYAWIWFIKIDLSTWTFLCSNISFFYCISNSFMSFIIYYLFTNNWCNFIFQNTLTSIIRFKYENFKSYKFKFIIIRWWTYIRFITCQENNGRTNCK